MKSNEIWDRKKLSAALNSKDFLLKQTEGYVKALEKSISPLSTMKEAFEHRLKIVLNVLSLLYELVNRLYSSEVVLTPRSLYKHRNG